MEAKKMRIADLTPEDLERMTADLDDSMVADKFRPLNANDRRIWERAKRKRPRRVSSIGNSRRANRKKSAIDEFLAKSVAERNEYVKRFDEPFVADKARPLTAAERALWERAKRRRGRPMNGNGAAVISISLERSLLSASDKLAKKKGITRSNLIARGLRAIIASEGLAVPAMPSTKE